MATHQIHGLHARPHKRAQAPRETHDSSRKGVQVLALFSFSVLLAIALAALTAAALYTGSYQEKIDLENRTVSRLNFNTSAFVTAICKQGPVAFAYLDKHKRYTPTPAEISALAPAEGLSAFSLNPTTIMAPVLNEQAAQAITDASLFFENRGYNYSCLIVSLNTGRGLGLNYDTAIYGASAFKGPFAAFVCEMRFDGEGRELNSAAESLIRSAVESSSNDAHRSLFNGYSAGLSSWIANMGIESSSLGRLRFPTYSAQESTAMWAQVSTYLASGSNTAVWLAQRYENTNVSHIRQALERGISEGSLTCSNSWRVMNKAGWIAGGPNSTSDAGIVEIDSQRYAISIMTGAPDSSASREACVQLALALLQAATSNN